MTDILSEHFKNIENSLIAQGAIQNSAGHSLHKGTPREHFISEFLQEHLPDTAAIGTGEIIDSNSEAGVCRPQHDVVVYRRHFPRISMGGGVRCYFAESVIATIEVKSTLNLKAIKQSAKAADYCKSLNLTHVKPMISSTMPRTIMSYTVAYKSDITIGRGVSHIKHEEEEHGYGKFLRPAISKGVRHRHIAPSLDGIFVLGVGCGYYSSIHGAPTHKAMPSANAMSPDRWRLLHGEGVGLRTLFLLISTISNNLHWFDPSPYFEPIAPQAERWSDPDKSG